MGSAAIALVFGFAAASCSPDPEAVGASAPSLWQREMKTRGAARRQAMSTNGTKDCLRRLRWLGRLRLQAGPVQAWNWDRLHRCCPLRVGRIVPLLFWLSIRSFGSVGNGLF
jgi:hypothetical protein